MLYPLLGFKHQAFPAGLGWHDRVQEGVPRLALWCLARALHVPVKEVAALVDVPEGDLVWSQRREPLSPEASAQLYRVALALHRLYPVLPSPHVAAAWLKNPRRELNGMVPIRLLLSQPGADLVFAAISKIVVIKAVPRSEPEPVEQEEEEDIDPADDPMLK